MSAGKDVVAAIKKATTWGTAVECGAGDGLLLIGDGIKHSIENIPEDSAGQGFIESQDLGKVDCQASPEMYLRYDGALWTLVALLMGTAGAPAQQESTSAYLHSLVMAADLDGIFATLAVDKGHSVHELAGAKVAGITVSGEAGQPLTLSAELIADDLTRNTSSGTNNNTTMASVTITDKLHRVLFSQGVFRINAQGGSALASPTDVITPRAFTLTINRPHTTDYTDANTIEEPLANDFPEVTLRLEFKDYDTDTWLDAVANGTAKKADITFIGDTIEGAYPYTFTLEFPNLLPTSADDPQVNKAARLPNAVDFRCAGAASAPTGMTGITQPLKISVINTTTTDLLA